MGRNAAPAIRELLAAIRWKSPAAWGRGLRLVLLLWVIVLGHKPGRMTDWTSPVRTTGTETNRPLDSESPVDPQETAGEGEVLFCGQRSERSLRGDLARCKLPPNHLAAHFSRGRSFLIAESCFGSEHALRSGNCSHLRC